MSGYIDAKDVVALRIFSEESSDGMQWSLDGIDRQGGYTERVWSFDTWAGAMGALVDFYVEAVLVERKRRGIDCTADESCVILGYFDRHALGMDLPEDANVTEVAWLFPQERDQWWREREQGYR